VLVRPASAPVAALILGHGAGGGVGARDLVTATEVALSMSITTVLAEQPYRVAGRRSPAPAPQLDAAWTTVVERLRDHELSGLPVIVGGRSSGARVACRTATDTGAIAVLCLAFPLHPPGRPDRTRQPELDAVRLPTLVVQGESDPFGLPAAASNRRVVTVRGTHSLATDLDAVAAAVRSWLARIVTRGARGPGRATRTGARRAR
jgi:predicted alpha/beta-hydrolase family hydrolase